ncbi:hypothetical protein B0H13DRAFT_2353897 [Mycena leptocephala]|nr:hypothetical protein B0H13DRAFT_2353897 [Mycena leptocephala]
MKDLLRLLASPPPSSPPKCPVLNCAVHHTPGNGLSALEFRGFQSVPSPSYPDDTIFHALGFVPCFAPNSSTIFMLQTNYPSSQHALYDASRSQLLLPFSPHLA